MTIWLTVDTCLNHSSCLEYLYDVYSILARALMAPTTWAQLCEGTELWPWPWPHQILKNTKTKTTTLTATLQPHWVQLVHCAGEAGDPYGWAWWRRTTPPTCSSWIEVFNCIDHDTFVDFYLSWGLLACALRDQKSSTCNFKGGKHFHHDPGTGIL